MIIGICGLIGSGKGTVADILVTDYNFQKISFADKLKSGVAAIFGWDRELLEGVTDKSRAWREEVDFFWTKETGTQTSPRTILQLFGTECMREGFFDGIWVSLVKKELLENPDTDFVIPDVRFINEINMIRQLGGEMWRVKRGDDPLWYSSYVKNKIPPKKIHPSEWKWIDGKISKTIENDSDHSHLSHKIRSLLATKPVF